MEKLKMAAYVAVIILALAVGYRQLVPATSTPAPETTVKQIEAQAEAKVQEAESKAKLELQAAEAEANRREKIRSLLTRQTLLQKNLDEYTQALAKDNNRLIKRISRDSLPAIHVRMAAWEDEIKAIDKKLGELRYDPTEPATRVKF